MKLLPTKNKAKKKSPHIEGIFNLKLNSITIKLSITSLIYLLHIGQFAINP
jgi:hypothetical protein